MPEWIVKAETLADIVNGLWTGGKKLVQCKDCKNYGTDGNCLNCNVFCCSMPKNGFCSMGERRN